SGIERPRDLVGRRVMVSSDSETVHRTLLRKVGIATEDVEQIPFEGEVSPLITGEVDAHMVYRTGTGLAFDETGEEVSWIWPANYGIEWYADTIVVRETRVRQDPDLVEGFLQATLKGWRYAIENQSEAVDMTLQYDPTLTRDRQARMMRTQTPLIHTGEAELGWMERDVWEKMRDMLLEEDILAMEDIEERATTVARQMADYINEHPDMTLEDLQADPRAWEIAVQTVGETGYTVVADAATGMAYFHPNPQVVGEDPAQSRKAFPTMWEIIDRTIGSQCQDSSGFYGWAAEGETREKYTYLACVEAATADGTRLFVGASAYLDDYDLARMDIDEAFTMQFLKEIYGKAK
ncbi:MAG: ABC transporter substrate-binding protein, partial [Chloroflexota bacterium]